MGMGTGWSRRDNVMQNIALETNALEHDRKRSQNEEISKKQQLAGRIAFGVVLVLLAVIIGAFVVMHL